MSQVRFAFIIFALAGVCVGQKIQAKHDPITGRITARDGTPVAGVKVSGSEWKCCPSQYDTATTDQNGSFRIEHPGAVLHVLPSEDFQPQVLVVAPHMSTLNVTLDRVGPSLAIAACHDLQRGMERIGWGTNGLQFDVPTHKVKLIRGKSDVDYVVHIVKAKSGDDRVELWFGPYALSSTPDDKQFVESESFAIRGVTMLSGLIQGSDGGTVGADVSGHLSDGKVWRQTNVGLEGARYRNVSPENAAIFDRIIDSACWKATAKP
jgi:hypothetical protein